MCDGCYYYVLRRGKPVKASELQPVHAWFEKTRLKRERMARLVVAEPTEVNNEHK